MKRQITITYCSDTEDVKSTEGKILVSALEILNQSGGGNICLQASEVPEVKIRMTRTLSDMGLKEITIPEFLRNRGERRCV